MSTHLMKIKQMIQEDELNTALSYLNDLIQHQPDNDEAYYLLGNIYRKQGNWQMALNEILIVRPYMHARC